MRFFKLLFIAVLIVNSQTSRAFNGNSSEASAFGSAVISGIVILGPSFLAKNASDESAGSGASTVKDIPGEWQVTEMTTAENGKYKVVVKNGEDTAIMFWDQQPKPVMDALKVGDQVRFLARKEGWLLEKIGENKALAYIPQTRFQYDLKSEKWTSSQNSN